MLCRKLMKAKGPAAAKTDEEKKKGLELFRPKPPTPQMLRAFGRFNKNGFMDKLKVKEITKGMLKALRGMAEMMFIFCVYKYAQINN